MIKDRRFKIKYFILPLLVSSLGTVPLITTSCSKLNFSNYSNTSINVVSSGSINNSNNQRWIDSFISGLFTIQKQENNESVYYATDIFKKELLQTGNLIKFYNFFSPPDKTIESLKLINDKGVKDRYGRYTAVFDAELKFANGSVSQCYLDFQSHSIGYSEISSINTKLEEEYEKSPNNPNVQELYNEFSNDTYGIFKKTMTTISVYGRGFLVGYSIQLSEKQYPYNTILSLSAPLKINGEYIVGI